MRKIETVDIFTAVRLIDDMGLKEELLPVIKKIAEEGRDALDSGILGILTIISRLGNTRTEKAIYKLCSGIAECTEKEFEHMELDKLSDFLERLETENNLPRFFSLVSGLLTKR